MTDRIDRDKLLAVARRAVEECAKIVDAFIAETYTEDALLRAVSGKLRASSIAEEAVRAVEQERKDG